MQNLFAFLLKYRFFFVFLILEIIAFSMIINHSIYQRYVLVSSANKFTGSLYGLRAEISDYFSLKKENQILAEENARLREILHSSAAQVITPADTLPDVSDHELFDYIPAKVISNSTNKRNNYLMLNRGRRHGIDREMAVVSPQGVVGIVVNVSENFCWVMSVLNKNTKINGRLKRTNYQGSLSWDGLDYQKGTFSDVPSHVEILKGDTLVTSGFSLMFPANIMIGTVEDFFIGRGDHFFTVRLRFSVDYNRLSNVYIIRNLMREEQLSIIEYL